MDRTRLFLLLPACLVVGSLAAAGRQDAAPHPTRVVHFTAPVALPEPSKSGTCAPSSAAWYRTDAFKCTSGKATHDPCFRTAREGHVLCGVDPRQPSSGTLVAMASPPAGPAAPGHPVHPRHRAWFFELTDGSLCEPLTSPGREFDGAVELYSCRFGSAGEADAVLGDLDDSAPVWTIQKVLINKKVEPQTIKSLMIATVKAVWE